MTPGPYRTPERPPPTPAPKPKSRLPQSTLASYTDMSLRLAWLRVWQAVGLVLLLSGLVLRHCATPEAPTAPCSPIEVCCEPR